MPSSISLNRIEIIDTLLHSKGQIRDFKTLKRLVNQELVARGKKPVKDASLNADIQGLRKMLKGKGATLQNNPKKGGYYYDQASFQLYPALITEEDKELFALATNLFEQFKGTPLLQKFEETANKILAKTVFPNALSGLRNVEMVAFPQVEQDQATKWLMNLLQAIMRRETLRMEYQGFGKPRKVKHIAPYLLKNHENRWYLVAYDFNCERPDKTSVFAVDGIKELGPSSKPFRQDNFNERDYFKYSLGVWHWHEQKPITVQLLFTDYMDMIQHTPLHASQKAVRSSDGKSLHVELEVYNTPELHRLILGFGAKVKVLGPAPLVTKIREEARKLAQFY